jgi:hypothetical protein
MSFKFTGSLAGGVLFVLLLIGGIISGVLLESLDAIALFFAHTFYRQP